MAGHVPNITQLKIIKIIITIKTTIRTKMTYFTKKKPENTQ
jgi:hypothetical protein